MKKNSTEVVPKIVGGQVMDIDIEESRVAILDITHITLNKKNDIKILRGFERIDGKKYMRNWVVMIGNTIITDNFADSIIFKEELALYDTNDDVNNIFFKIAKRTVDERESKTLSLKAGDRSIYISKAEAKSIVTIWNMALHGYSFSRLLEYPEESTAEAWALALQHSGYLS